MNLDETLNYVIGQSPDELVTLLNSIEVPFKIIAIVPQGTRHVAYYVVQSECKKPKSSKSKGVK